jgi:hypothetical protein
MEASGHQQAPVALASGKELPVPTEYNADMSHSWSGPVRSGPVTIQPMPPVE